MRRCLKHGFATRLIAVHFGLGLPVAPSERKKEPPSS
jgi:hypothetical protein